VDSHIIKETKCVIANANGARKQLTPMFASDVIIRHHC